MKLLTSPALERDDDFVLAGGPLVHEWSVVKKQGRSSRRAEAAKAAAEKERDAAEKERVAAEKAAEKESKAAVMKGASAASKKPKKGAAKEITVDDDEDEDEDEDDGPLAPFKDKAWLKKTMVSKNQVNRRAPLREQLETIVTTLKIKPVPSTMGLMREAIYVKLKLNESAPDAAKPQDDPAKPQEEPAAWPKPKPPPPTPSEWICHIDSATDRPYMGEHQVGFGGLAEPFQEAEAAACAAAAGAAAGGAADGDASAAARADNADAGAADCVTCIVVVETFD